MKDDKQILAVDNQSTPTKNPPDLSHHPSGLLPTSQKNTIDKMERNESNGDIDPVLKLPSINKKHSQNI